MHYDIKLEMKFSIHLFNNLCIFVQTVTKSGFGIIALEKNVNMITANVLLCHVIKDVIMFHLLLFIGGYKYVRF